VIKNSAGGAAVPAGIEHSPSVVRSGKSVAIVNRGGGYHKVPGYVPLGLFSRVAQMARAMGRRFRFAVSRSSDDKERHPRIYTRPSSAARSLKNP